MLGFFPFRPRMTDSNSVTLSGLCVFAAFSLQNVNVVIALLTGLCGFIVILPKTIETIKRTNWRNLFRREKL